MIALASDRVLTYGALVVRLPLIPGFLALALVTALTSRGAGTSSSPPSRLVHLTVLQVDGKPAAHRAVYLRGWSSPWGFRNWGPIGEIDDAPDRYGKADGWPYTTDEAGKVIVPIGDFRAQPYAGPAWGTYAFLIDAGPDDAGGVSPRFYSGPPPDLKEDWASEWGKPIPLPIQGLNLTLQIQDGITVKGRVVDDQHLEKPLVGVEVSAGTDLNIGTRSGVGDHIFYATAKTDRDGRFVLRHRFPNYLWIDVMPALWMRTKINGVWTEVDNRIKPDPSTNTIELEMAARPHPAFRYSGRLTDSKGSPMGSIQVELTAATEPRHFHEHHFQVVDTQTHADGTYSAVTPSPWVTDINASLRQDDHYSLIAQKMAGERPMPPGIYDLHSDPAPGEKSPPAVAK